MDKAIGIIEMKNIARSVLIADACLKNASISLSFRTLCPGKSLLILTGDLSSVKSSLEVAEKLAEGYLTDTLLLGNIHPGVLPAIAGTADVKHGTALGVIETFTVPAAIKAADIGVKTARVDVIDLRAAQGLGGKALAYITGDIADVSMALEAVKDMIGNDGCLLDTVMIAGPHKELWQQIP